MFCIDAKQVLERQVKRERNTGLGEASLVSM